MGRGAVEMKPESAAVAVAIDRDKGSQYAIKWAVDNLFTRGQLITLLHVKRTPPPLNLHSNHRGGTLSTSQEMEDAENVYKRPTDPETKELFLPFRSYCTKKLHIKCKDVVAEGPDIPTTLINYVITNSIEILVLGAPSRNGFFKSFKTTDVPSSVIKRIPDFCSVYVIGKSKISYVQTASAAAPHRARSQIQKQWSDVSSDHSAESPRKHKPRALERRTQSSPPSQLMVNGAAEIKSVRFRRGRGSATSNSYDFSREMEMETETETQSVSDISSFASSERPSVDSNIVPNSSLYDSDYSITSMSSSATTPRQSTCTSESDNRSSVSSSYSRYQFLDMTSSPYAAFSSSSTESGRSSAGTSASHNNMDDVKAEMRRLKLELKQTMEMYNKACKEAVIARHKAKELDRWKWEEEGRLQEALSAEEAALAAIEKEKAKCKAAAEAAEAALRTAELEAQNRINAERKVVQEIHENQNKALELQGRSRAYYYNNINNHNNYLSLRYRKYTIEEIEEATNNFSEGQKIGEGGYGPVYRGQVDHTQVAVKVLRSDAEQGRLQFQKEVEILSCIRHPNMVLLLGACPEKACLVYEFLANGSLEDRLFRRDNTPPIPWQVRFRIAAEIATGLLFLHQSKPEPLVHRDLKPANILLDRNYVSKISDVGLARLVPPSVSDSVTQFRMTSAAGTFCYIDPEYQQTGMLGTKSDVYSLGIMLLQLVTAKRAMGLTHRVETGIELGTFAEMLDPEVHDWPVEDATELAKLGLRCAELRRKDRPDLADVVVPQLNRFRQLAYQHFHNRMPGGGGGGYYSSSITSSQTSSSVSPKQEVQSDVHLPRSGQGKNYDS